MSLGDRRGPLGADPYGMFPIRGEQRVYLEASPKRVRLQVADTTVADSLRTQLLHQPGQPASRWFPRADVIEGALALRGDGAAHPLLGRARLFDLHVAGRVEPAFARDHPDVALAGLIHFDGERADAIYEEGERVAAEPIDPFHRVDVRDASRHVRVSLAGVVLAESTSPRMVFETTARPRFYFTADEVRTDLLVPSGRSAVCQYKGDGEYFDARVAGHTVADLVWRYTRPRDDGRRIAGRYALHHERCDTVVDGRVIAGAGE